MVSNVCMEPPFTKTSSYAYACAVLESVKEHTKVLVLHTATWLAGSRAEWVDEGIDQLVLQLGPAVEEQ